MQRVVFVSEIVYLCSKERRTNAGLIMSYEYRVQVPANERATFRLIARRMGWEVSTAKRKTGYQLAMEDLAAGRIHSAANAEEMISQILG